MRSVLASAEVLTTARVRRLLGNALRSEGFRRFGVPFARDYARIAWHAWRHWGDTGSGAMQLLGCRISYPNHNAALFLAHEVFVNGVYGFEARTARPRIIDCGANIGMSVIFFKSLYPNAEVIAFEPDPRTFARLEENVHGNRLADVRLINRALAAAPGTVRFYSDTAADGSIIASLDPARGGRLALTVQAVTLSSFIERPVDFLKIDVEGAEYGLVQELVDSGAVDQVHEMAIEVHADPHMPERRTILAGQLESAGFSVRITEMDDRACLLRASRRPSPGDAAARP
jgi:FkbM family methyltransferase